MEDRTICSFCGLTEDEAGEPHLQGPLAQICRECAELAMQAFNRRNARARQDTTTD